MDGQNLYRTPEADLTVPTPSPMIDRDVNPFSLAALTELYLRPSQFFAVGCRISSTAAVFLGIWLLGMANAIDRIDTKMAASDVNLGTGPLPAAIESWSTYWATVIVGGLFSGWFAWLIGGWWYRIRLELSGARNPDKRDARVLYVFSSLVAALPILLYSLYITATYENYLSSWQADELVSLLPLVFLVWSCVTSYLGARSRFHVQGLVPLLLFLLLPLALYGGIFAFIAYSYTQQVS